MKPHPQMLVWLGSDAFKWSIANQRLILNSACCAEDFGKTSEENLAVPTTYRPETSVRTSSGSAHTLAAGDNLIVDRGIVLSSVGAFGVDAATGSVITVNGTVAGDSALQFDGARVDVGSYGVLAGGDYAILNSSGHLALKNDGFMFGEVNGVRMYGSGTITNHGQIVGGISGESNASIYLTSNHTEAKIVNAGTIEAKLDGSFAILSNESNSASDTVVNLGKIIGRVALSGGDDSFNTIKGRVVGTIDGGSGEDTIKGGKFNDRILGGQDSDRLSGGKGSDEFEFLTGFGKDVIIDFDATGGGKKQDYLSLFDGSDYLEKSVNNGRDTLLDFGEGNTITLLHVKASDFSKADIHFDL